MPSLLSEAERGQTNPDIPAAAFGRLLGTLLSYRNDKYEKVLYDFGFALGKYIYLQDACVDFKKDLKKSVTIRLPRREKRTLTIY